MRSLPLICQISYPLRSASYEREEVEGPLYDAVVHAEAAVHLSLGAGVHHGSQQMVSCVHFLCGIVLAETGS